MLLIGEDLRGALYSAANYLVSNFPKSALELDAVRQAAESCRPLCVVSEVAQAILDEQGFIQISGFPPSHLETLFLGLVTLLGSVLIDPSEAGAVIPARVRPGQHLMGNQIRSLPLHTDYSMIARPPRLTMSLCLRSDSYANLGSLVVSDVESICFGLESSDDVVKFKTVVLPFAARNIKDEIEVFESPIITPTVDGGVLVRYHRSRIAQGFKHRGRPPSTEQSATMRIFERLTRENVNILPIAAGCVTILNNHRVVHGRDRCSVEVFLDGTTVGRQMLFAFAH